MQTSLTNLISDITNYNNLPYDLNAGINVLKPSGNIITDNIPHAIAAGILYFISQICQLNVSKQDIKTVSGVSEVTINKCFKKLEALKEILVPTSILEKYSC